MSTTQQENDKLLTTHRVGAKGIVVPQCQFIKWDNKQCKGIALKGQDYCAIHSGMKPWLTARIDITQSLTDVKKFLARLIKDTRAGKIPPQISNAVTNSANLLVKVHEIEEIQKYLADNVHNNARKELEDSIPADYEIEQ